MSKRQLISDLVKDVYLPKMFKVRQIFPRPKIEVEKIPSMIFETFSQEKFSSQIKAGMKIAITAGSRGIANEALIVKSIVDFVKSRGANPFVVPAMGSHGGATAAGQAQVLYDYGITESYIGCPIVSSMETKKIGVNEEGVSVFIDKNAAEADGIIINCRIKPHTDFHGTYESGMMKMMTIGLGKQYGAEVCHESGFKNMAKNIHLFGKTIIANAPIMFALATIENAFDETAEIIVLNSYEIEAQEPLYLKKAFANMPRIYADSCDVLVVDAMGKDFSGTGMDPNITGTWGTPYGGGGIDAQRVCVLDLSEASHGNAIGLGFVHITTQRLFDKLDLTPMYLNALTNTVPRSVFIPMIMESDKEAIQACVRTCNEIDKKNPRIVRIQNSLHIEHIWFSESYYDDLKKKSEHRHRKRDDRFSF